MKRNPRKTPARIGREGTQSEIDKPEGKKEKREEAGRDEWKRERERERVR